MSPLLIAVAVLAQPLEWGYPSPEQAATLLVPREQAMAMADSLGLDGEDRVEAEVAYAGYAGDFRAALDAWRATQVWIDSCYPSNYGGSDRELEWRLRADAHAYHAAWHRGVRELETELIDEIARLADADHAIAEMMHREQRRRRVLAAIGEQRGAPAGAGTDLDWLVVKYASRHAFEPEVIAIVDAYHARLDPRRGAQGRDDRGRAPHRRAGDAWAAKARDHAGDPGAEPRHGEGDRAGHRVGSVPRRGVARDPAVPLRSR
ncbi:MAG: hypothetical protein ACYTGP_02995 [Planctomycetota bacterium]|jgi:hypothetical protein